MGLSSAEILALFKPSTGQPYRTPLFAPYLSVNRAYGELLAALGDPQDHLPPVFHVGGTNGKGSTCAFLCALAEAAGKKAHLYTSPHLVRPHERTRIAGQMVGEEEWAEALTLCAAKADPQKISTFEAQTAAALWLFARHPADITILEVGMGGRLDATNVVTHPAAVCIARISHDHGTFLGDSLAEIAREKSGIMRPGAPCLTAPQPNPEVLAIFEQSAAESGAALHRGGVSWRVTERETDFLFEDEERSWVLPHPALLGAHQFNNAGLALAASRFFPFEITQDIAIEAMRLVRWPARLQRLEKGRLADLVKPGGELWVDGGHNDSAGEVLGVQIAKWKKEKPDLPVFMLCGMLAKKDQAAFLRPIAAVADGFAAVSITGQESFPTDRFVALALSLGFQKAQAASSVAAAIESFGKGRILICGSLYLAGEVLAANDPSLSSAP